MVAGLGSIQPCADCPQMICDTVIGIQLRPELNSSLTFDGLNTNVPLRANARLPNSDRVS
jgi:hypothetical protein